MLIHADRDPGFRLRPSSIGRSQNRSARHLFLAILPLFPTVPPIFFRARLKGEKTNTSHDLLLLRIMHDPVHRAPPTSTTSSAPSVPRANRGNPERQSTMQIKSCCDKRTCEKCLFTVGVGAQSVERDICGVIWNSGALWPWGPSTVKDAAARCMACKPNPDDGGVQHHVCSVRSMCTRDERWAIP